MHILSASASLVDLMRVLRDLVTRAPVVPHPSGSRDVNDAEKQDQSAPIDQCGELGSAHLLTLPFFPVLISGEVLNDLSNFAIQSYALIQSLSCSPTPEFDTVLVAKKCRAAYAVAPCQWAHRGYDCFPQHGSSDSNDDGSNNSIVGCDGIYD
jgi:hypothetical protein